MNKYLSSLTYYGYGNRWYTFRMDMLSLLTIVLTATFSVAAKGEVTSAVAGLAMANIFQVCTFIPFVMRLKAEFRARFNSVERVAEYAYVRYIILKCA